MMKTQRYRAYSGHCFGAWAVACCILLAAMAACVRADDVAPPQGAQPSLANLSLEELMNIEVTSVSKKPEKLWEASSAVYVITQEDIRRSGMTSIPELLRMATGMLAAHINSSMWAISARGFTERYAKMLLVLIDGRTVYTPTFSGVYWDEKDTLLEDIERIEVIRGPGATLWGANAVNGVINIITKNARDTQGAIVTVDAGVGEDRALGGVRYGGKLGDNGCYRAYAKKSNRSAFVDASDRETNDAWHRSCGGFRIDRDLSEKDSLTFQGDAYHGDVAQTLTVPLLVPPYAEVVDDTAVMSGRNLLTRWNCVISDTSDMSLQLYYDRTRRRDSQAGEAQDTWDLDFQHRFALGRRQEIVWGLGYRYTTDQYGSTYWMSIEPASRTEHLVSAFVQDELELCKDRLRLTLGSKFEHNSYTGFEVQPNARLVWMPNERKTIWASISRAVRTPSRFEMGSRIKFEAFPPDPADPGGLPALVTLFGNPGFKSEELLAYELGYRVQPTDTLSLDIAAFYNVYDKLRVGRVDTPFFEPDPAPHIVIPVQLCNGKYGSTYGLEVAADWTASSRWRLAAGYSFIYVPKEFKTSGDGSFVGSFERMSPRHQFNLRSYLDLPGDLEFDAALYYVDGMESFSMSSSQGAPNIPSYLRLDVRLGWHPARDLDVSVGVRNLLDDRHLEFCSTFGEEMTEVPRSVYGKVTWRF